MNRIRCMIIDDEPPAIALLEKYAGMISQLEVVGTSQSAVKAFELLKETAVDLLFLDIRMPVLNGIDFIKTLQHPPAVIITTAYREYALEGYDLDIIDYLLKPISFDRFLKAVDRYQERHKDPVSSNQDAPALDSSSEKDYIYFNINKTNHKVKYDEIKYIESLKDYVSIYLPNERLIVKGSIGTIMKQLPDSRFMRIHRSYVIPISAVQSYNQSFIQVHGEKLPIGVSYREEVTSRLGS